MGQKVNPIGLRLGISKTWESNWYSGRNYAEELKQDLAIKKYIRDNLSHAGIAKIEVEKAAKKTKVVIHASRPGIIIGRKGEDAAKLKQSIAKFVNHELIVNIKEVKRPDTESQLIADSVAQQLLKRVAYRRVIKKAIQKVMRSNVTGCKIMVAGRLNGAEMARTEWVREGRVPLHTLKAEIDYSTSEAHTTYGIIGVKVWVYKGEQFATSQGRRRKAK